MRASILVACFIFFVSGISRADVLVCDEANDSVLRYDNEGNYIDDFIPSGTQMLDGPRRIELGPDGNIYVMSRNNNSILRYTYPAGQFAGNFALGGGLSDLKEIAFGPDGDLYVADGQALKQFDGKTGAFVRDVFPAGITARFMKFQEGTGRLYVSSGTLFFYIYDIDFANQTNDELALFFATGKASNGGFDFGPGVGLKGDLYIRVNDNKTHQVYRHDAITGLFQQIFIFETPSAGNTGQLSFMPNGEILIGNHDDKSIDIYDGQLGTFQGVFISNLANNPADFIFVGPITGDVNCDGEVNLLDVAPFIQAFSAGNYVEKADINGDGVVSLMDIPLFVALLTRE